MAIIGQNLGRDSLVLQRGRDFRWKFQNINPATKQPANYPSGQLYLELHTQGQHNALQEIRVLAASDGTYKLYRGEDPTSDLDYYDNTASVTAALEALPGVGDGNVKVTPVSLVPVWRLDLTLNAGSNEVQRIVFSNTNGGTFRLSCGAYVTSNLSYGISAADMQTALRGLTSIGSGNCNVTKVSDAHYTVEFVGSKAATNMPPIIGWGLGPGFGLTGSILPGKIKTATLVQGSAKISESLVAVLTETVNEFFDGFENLLGVDIDVTITDELNVTLVATSKKSYAENDLTAFAVDVTSTALEQFLNGVSTFLGAFNSVSVDFYWNRVYRVEFVGNLANTPQEALVADATDLEGDTNEQRIEVQVLKPGKAEFTKWPFVIVDDLATLKVDEGEADAIAAGTPWQLVFMPAGEESGGDPVALGTVRAQP